MAEKIVHLNSKIKVTPALRPKIGVYPGRNRDRRVTTIGVNNEQWAEFYVIVDELIIPLLQFDEDIEVLEVQDLPTPGFAYLRSLNW